MRFGGTGIAAAFALGIVLAPAAVRGQSVPWEVYVDEFSSSVCDVINVANGELVVLGDTGELVLVTGADLVLALTFVDAAGFVFFAGDPAGVIGFEEDGDGFRTLWWMSLTGNVVQVDPFTGEPLVTNLFPTNFSNVPCDACDFWDDPTECFPITTDDDVDGLPDIIDLCLGTPLFEETDEDGCSCGQLDGDFDGVDNCEDFCPDSPFNVLVDFLGCSCADLDDDEDDVNDCDDECPDTFPGDIVDFAGCSCDQTDGDGDGIDDCTDECPGTPLIDDVDFAGCAIDDSVDGDGSVVSVACGSVGLIGYAFMLVGLVGVSASRRRW